MKAAVLIAHYDKNAQLRNTLAGIARQVTTFPFEVCIIDDHSKVDPVSIVEEQLWGKSSMMSYKYKRLEKNVGGQFSHGMCMDLVSDDVDVIVVMSCDVVMVGTNIIEELCKRVKGKQVVTAEVHDIPIPEDMYKNFEAHIERSMKMWDGARTYSNPIRMYMFLSAVRRDYLEMSGYCELNCDYITHIQFERMGMKHYIYQDLKAIHQHHKNLEYTCSIQKDCEYPCMKNRGKRRYRMEHPK